MLLLRHHSAASYVTISHSSVIWSEGGIGIDEILLKHWSSIAGPVSHTRTLVLAKLVHSTIQII